MAFTCKVSLAVTDESTGVETMKVELTEGDVSTEDMLDLEGDLMKVALNRFEKQAKKMKG